MGCASSNLLHEAARDGDVPALSLLLQSSSSRASLSKLDADGLSALHYASLRGHTDACRLLIQRGADVNAVARVRLSSVR
jgi:ankyrin repeat protein